MDLAELQAKDRAARVAELAIDGRRFTFLLPKQAQIEDTLARAGADADEALPLARFNRLLLLDSLTGWDGVTLADLVDGCGSEPAPFTRGHAELLVDDGGTLGAELRLRFANLVAERRKRIEDARKNSASA